MALEGDSYRRGDASGLGRQILDRQMLGGAIGDRILERGASKLSREANIRQGSSGVAPEDTQRSIVEYRAKSDILFGRHK